MVVTGDDLLYLWELGSGESLPTSEARFSGVLSPSLTIYDVRTSDAGNYTCSATNSGGSVSSSAQLIISELWKRRIIKYSLFGAEVVLRLSNMLSFSIVGIG